MTAEITDILELAIPTRLRHTLDYLPAPEHTKVKDWAPGVRIQTTFGKKNVVGVLINVKSSTDIPIEKIKTITAKIDDQPVLTPAILKLCYWASEYYHYPLGEIINQALPKTLREGKPLNQTIAHAPFTFSTHIPENLELNAHQREAVNRIDQAQDFQTFLLDGVTGSGKTEVYFRCIENRLSKGQQALILVPEINLTPQMVERFQQRFNVSIALLHSNIPAKKKFENWQAARSGVAGIIIGTRSAIFTPLYNPGIIILDEEHDLSFKQQSNLRYSARDVAIIRGQFENVPVVLGSATPSLESYYNAHLKKYFYLALPERTGGAISPVIQVINIRDKRLTGGLSQILLEKMQEHLQNQGQVLLFLNRRGYASVLMCHHCGWMAECPCCDAYYTLHFNPQRLRCHHCESNRALPKHCQQCKQSELIQVGQGTQRIEEIIQEKFPDYKMVRIDKDSTKQRGSLEKFLNQIHAQETQILIGTQMLSKGHHFPHLTMVAIVEADGGMFSIDFRALERMGQLLVQVGGRAGRSDKKGEVLIQTHFPHHPLLQLLLKFGYRKFAAALLKERKETELPPFMFLALLRAESKTRELTYEFLNAIKELAECKLATDHKHIQLLGPIPSIMEKCAGRFRGHLLIKSPKRQSLQNFLKQLMPTISTLPSVKKIRWSLDVDPQEIS